jgi:hypothetical protein
MALITDGHLRLRHIGLLDFSEGVVGRRRGGEEFVPSELPLC